VDCIPFNFWTDTFKPYLGRRYFLASGAAQAILVLFIAIAVYYGITSAARITGDLGLPSGLYVTGVAFILYFVHWHYQWRYVRFLLQKTGIEPSVRAELFSKGIYPEGHDFENGAHPFFYWRDLLEIELTYAGLRHTVKFTFTSESEPYVWTLYSEQIAELGAVVASAPEMRESMLARALAEHRTKLASGQTFGTITIKASE
jgi:hypothetical protein